MGAFLSVLSTYGISYRKRTLLACDGVGSRDDLFFQAPLIALQTNVTPKDMATATSTFSFARTLADATSVAIGQVIFQNEMQKHTSRLLATGIPSSLGTSLANGAAASCTSAIAGLLPEQRVIIREATADSLSRMWILYTCLSAVGLLASFGIGIR